MKRDEEVRNEERSAMEKEVLTFKRLSPGVEGLDEYISA